MSVLILDKAPAADDVDDVDDVFEPRRDTIRTVNIATLGF